MDFDEEDSYEYLSISDNETLKESIAQRIEDAIMKIKDRQNYLQIEIKFGKLLDKDSNLRINDDNSSIIKSKNFYNFNSNIGKRHWRKINNYIRNDFGNHYEPKEKYTKDIIYNRNSNRIIITSDYNNPGETCHIKRRIDDIFIYNPYGEFDFRISISEKINRGKTTRKKTKRDGKLILTRDKERNIWYDNINGTEFKSTTVIETPSKNPKKYEFEIELDIEYVVDDIRKRDDDYYQDDVQEFIYNLINEADSINKDIS